MKIRTLLFYLLLLFLPTQLGKHFFFDFSFILGIRSDYLAPTIYITDVIILFLSISQVLTILFSKQKKKYWSGYWLIILLILFVPGLFTAVNKPVAFYKLAKLMEFIVLGLILTDLKPKLQVVTRVLAVDIIYSSVIAIGQFLLQKSIGSWLWLIGERSFTKSTPGIALYSVPGFLKQGGQLILRPYSIFPHPNVLGGFLAVGLVLILFDLIQSAKSKSVERVWGCINLAGFVIGLLALILTFSRLAWLTFIIGTVLIIFRSKILILLEEIWIKKFILVMFYLLVGTSIVSVLISSSNNYTDKSITERKFQVQAALEIIRQNPLTGLGLNNYIVQAYKYLPKSYEPYLLQPVHNAYLLIWAESGIVGLLLSLGLLISGFYRSLKTNLIIAISIFQIFIIGLFDHYIFTLQQPLLLLTVIMSISFSQNTCFKENK